MQKPFVRWIVGLALIVGAGAFALFRLAPCAFASSQAPAESIVTEVERWLEIDPPFPEKRDTSRPDNQAPLIDLSVREVSEGGATGDVAREVVAVDGALIEDIDAALDDGSRVFLGLGSTGLTQEQVISAVARRSDGTHVFLGGCFIDSSAAWLRGFLGDRYEPAMRRIIGLTDRDAIYSVLAGVREAPGHVLVEYEGRPDVRLFPRTGTLVERDGCLALLTDVGPLVPMWRAGHYLAVDDRGVVLMNELQPVARPGDVMELAGREMSPDEALALTARASLRSCPGRLILVG